MLTWTPASQTLIEKEEKLVCDCESKNPFTKPNDDFRVYRALGRLIVQCARCGKCFTGVA